MSEPSLPSLRLRVPFVDLWPVHAPLKETLVRDVQDLLERGVFLNGPEIEEFESAFAAYCDTIRCVAVSSGLDALRLALVGAGIDPGEEVILPALTFAATFEAVIQAGGVPVPVDITLRDYNLDPGAAAAAITSRSRFLLPVHLYGQVADMRAVGALSVRHGLEVIEDACQAHGARRDGAVAGSLGLAGAFSFYPTKNLGAIGDAGAIVTNDRELAARARSLRAHGQTSKYVHETVGYTARMDCVQAVVLRRKLDLLDAWNDARRATARLYRDLLENVGDLVLPPIAPGSKPVWHLFVIRTRHADELATFLADRGIGTGRHYPEPPHLSPAYAHLGFGRGSFPVTEAVAAECLSLPLYPGINEVQVESVAGAVADFFARG